MKPRVWFSRALQGYMCSDCVYRPDKHGVFVANVYGGPTMEAAYGAWKHANP